MPRVKGIRGLRSKPKRNMDSRPRRNPGNEISRTIIRQEPDDRFFVIGKLLDRRLDKDGKEEYLVRWQNYSPDWDSWEPREELERNAKDMILEFNRIRQEDDEPEKLHCICHRPYRFDQGGMIQCFYCMTWYHFTCINMNMEDANAYAKYYCNECTKFNPSNKSIIKDTKLNTFYAWSLSQDDSD